MFSCNCLNIVIEVEKNDNVTKEALEFSTESFCNPDEWYVGKLTNINKMHPGLIQTKQTGFWSITVCLNCEVQTHAIHKEKGASNTLVNSKLLSKEAINNIKSSDLVSSIFQIVVNPNANGTDNSVVETYHNKKLDKFIKDFNDVVTNFIRKEQAAVEERIKKYSDSEYEQLNILKDKAYKEREALVRILQNASTCTENDMSPKSPKIFGLSSEKHSPVSYTSPSDVPFSPKRPKSIGTEEPKEQGDLREDFMFHFETDYYTENPFNSRTVDDSDDDRIEEVEDIISEEPGITILQPRSIGSNSSIAKSCPVDIPNFPQLMKSKNGRIGNGNKEDGFSPRQNEEFDMAASIKALARSVHGDAIFGDLPRPKFNTQI